VHRSALDPLSKQAIGDLRKELNARGTWIGKKVTALFLYDEQIIAQQRVPCLNESSPETRFPISAVTHKAYSLPINHYCGRMKRLNASFEESTGEHMPQEIGVKRLVGGIRMRTADHTAAISRDQELEEPGPSKIKRAIPEASVVKPSWGVWAYVGFPRCLGEEREGTLDKFNICRL